MYFSLQVIASSPGSSVHFTFLLKHAHGPADRATAGSNYYRFCPVVFQNHEPRVAETAVVGYPHELYGEGLHPNTANQQI